MPINPTDLSQPGAPHVDSYWAATAGAEVEAADPIAGDMEVDVAIIGGGYTGLSAAYHLARDHGIAAHVLEAHRIGWGCSGRNGGFCSIGIGKDDFGDWVAALRPRRRQARLRAGPRGRAQRSRESSMTSKSMSTAARKAGSSWRTGPIASARWRRASAI